MNTSNTKFRFMKYSDDPEFFDRDKSKIVAGYNLDGLGSVAIIVNNELISVSYEDYIYFKFRERFKPQEYSSRIKRKLHREFKHVPAELKKYRQWMCARWTLSQERPMLRPIRYGGDRYTWEDEVHPVIFLSFEEAIEAVGKWGFDHLIFVITKDDPFSAVIMRNKTGSESWVYTNHVVKELGSYTEYFAMRFSSPAAQIIVKAKVGEELLANDAIMIIGNGMFVTISGQHVTGTSFTIEARQKELDEIRRKYF